MSGGKGNEGILHERQLPEPKGEASALSEHLGKMMGDAEAMKRFGNTAVIWDLHTRQPKKVLDVPGAE